MAVRIKLYIVERIKKETSEAVARDGGQLHKFCSMTQEDHGRNCTWFGANFEVADYEKG